MSLLLSSALETKNCKVILGPKSSGSYSSFTTIVQRIKRELCHLSNCSSVQLPDLLSFHLDMETTFSPMNALFQSLALPQTP